MERQRYIDKEEEGKKERLREIERESWIKIERARLREGSEREREG